MASRIRLDLSTHNPDQLRAAIAEAPDGTGLHAVAGGRVASTDANLVQVNGRMLTMEEAVVFLDGAPLADRLTGADSQCALTMRIAFGRGRSAAQAASWPDQIGSSRSGGAPWPMYRAGMRACMTSLLAIRICIPPPGCVVDGVARACRRPGVPRPARGPAQPAARQ